MTKLISRAWTAFLVVCFPLHALLRIVTTKSEAEIASWPFFGTACLIGSALIFAAIAAFGCMARAQAAMATAVIAALYAFAMVDYFKKVLKAKGNSVA